MAAIIIDVTCELAAASSPPAQPHSVRDALTADLAVIAEDLGLDAEFRVDVGSLPVDAPPVKGRKKKRSGNPLAMYINGVPLPGAQDGAVETVRAHLGELIAPRLADRFWEQWGGRSVAPPAFDALLRELVRHGIRPDRVSSAVATWPQHDPLQLFEEALGRVSRRISVHVHPERSAELAAVFAPDEASPASLMIENLFYELGVIAGGCDVVPDGSLSRDLARVRINDLRSTAFPLLAADECAVKETAARLRLLGIDARDTSNPANGIDYAIVSKAGATLAQEAGFTIVDSPGWVILSTSALVRRSAGALLDLDAVQSMLDKLETAFPYLTGYVKKRVGEEKFARVLRHLVHEEISIRDLRHIIAGLATMAPPSNAPLGSQLIVFVNTYSAAPADSVPSGRLADRAATEVAEMARVSLKRYISHKYTRGQNTLIVYLLESELEQRLARRQPLSNAERRWLIESVRTEVGSLPPTAHNPCLLTTTDIRWRLRCELGGSFPNLAVLCYQELSPEMNIQPIARIKLDDPPPTGPLDRVDEAIHELRFQEAEEALEDLVASRPPWAVVEPRLTELLYFWNEAGDAERVVRNLSIWPELRGEPAETWEIANHRDQAAVRRWLTTRDRWRRLRAQYMPAAEDFVQVKGGSFSMGEPGATQGDRPAHTVGVDDFAVASLPVTGRQFALFLAANQKPIPRDWVRADEAARGIGWREAIEYCRWLTRVSGLENVYTVPASSADGSASAGMAVEAHHQRNGFRLPTEAEWEYAARGGAASRGLRFAGSDSLADAGDVLGLDPAGLRRANELGLYEMSGGRAEWCWDWYGADFYNQSPIRNPMGPAEGASRVCRGGDVTGLGNVDACTVHAREGAARRLAAYRSMNLGFRLFRSALDR